MLSGPRCGPGLVSALSILADSEDVDGGVDAFGEGFLLDFPPLSAFVGLNGPLVLLGVAFLYVEYDYTLVQEEFLGVVACFSVLFLLQGGGDVLVACPVDEVYGDSAAWVSRVVGWYPPVAFGTEAGSGDLLMVGQAHDFGGGCAQQFCCLAWGEPLTPGVC